MFLNLIGIYYNRHCIQEQLHIILYHFVYALTSTFCWGIHTDCRKREEKSLMQIPWSSMNVFYTV